jgi:CRISPR type I-E-associated protein CasB/Cse2
LSEGRAIDLAQRLGRGPNNPRQLEWVGVLAALLAQVRSDLRSDTPQVTARHLGETRGERQLYAPARFRRLVVTDTPDDALIQFRRALQVLENKADIADLTHAVLHWTDRTKVRWTYAYHGAGALAENTAHTDTTKETTP